ncbi:MAG: type I-E CRISPR-associated protein Cse1/CasA [Pelolinea sp.]|nr:type I-E CRISPR-associated protein Cse1/CasA [Pelolinea sp.]
MNNPFNLIDEKWIPCQRLDGSTTEYSLIDLLTKAHETRTLVHDLPMEKVSLFRVLLAILHRNFGPASQAVWQKLWQENRFDEKKLKTYFSEWHHRFNLFDEKYPFYQTTDISVEIRPLNGYSFHLAVFHIASGNNATLFDHHTEEDEIIFSSAEAARLLINAQSFAFGFRSFKDGPSARGINFVARGKNLFETLMMNMILYNKHNPFHVLKEDMPTWERYNAFTPDRTKPDGYLDYLTWQCRKVLMHVEGDGAFVNRIQVDNGLKLDVNGEPYTKNPMMQYSKVESLAGGGAPFRPLKFQEGKALWRDSTSILEINSSDTEAPAVVKWLSECRLNQSTVRMNSIGISSDQGKVNFYLEELFTFPKKYLENDRLLAQLKTCLTQAEEVRNKLWGSVNRMAEIVLSSDADREEGRKADKKDKQQLIDHIFAEYQYWSQLETPFYQLLNDLSEKDFKAMGDWQHVVRGSAWHAFEFARDFIGNSPNALKAGALGGCVLGSGLNKVFED